MSKKKAKGADTVFELKKQLILSEAGTKESNTRVGPGERMHYHCQSFQERKDSVCEREVSNERHTWRAKCTESRGENG